MTFLVQASLFAALAVSYQAGEMSLNDVVQKVNPKMVKIYGSGGFKGLPAYGTGVLVSPNGYVLTVANHLMETTDLRVHLYDGTRLPAKLVAMEPELDIALLKIGTDKSKIDDLPFYDIVAAAKLPWQTQALLFLPSAISFKSQAETNPFR